MKEWTISIHNEHETEKLAQALAKLAWEGMLIALDGDLGAGKTTFSKALAKELGVLETVNSPTFTIIKEYKGTKLPFYHMDVYRISFEEASELGLDDYFFGNGVTVVEWASIIEDLLPDNRINLYLEYIDAEKRLVHVKARGDSYLACYEGLKQMGVKMNE